MATKKTVKYRVHFLSQGSVYQIYAKHISQSNMFGFVEIEGLIFGTTGSVVVDPSEDKLRREFEGVNRIYVPVSLVLRVDEVEKEGIAKIVDAKNITNNISQFPLTNPIDITKT